MEKGVCDLHSGTAEGAAFAGLLDTAGETARARAPAARRRLWDLRPDYHCSICGTCLSLADFRKVAGKAGLRLNGAATDHEVHGWFVKLASEPGRVAKSMHKLLDRKHRNAIERCRKMRGEANLRAFWEESLAKGDVSGPYWAIMTHPLASEALLVDAFGDVHMLSHLLGASNRADIRRLRVLETERGALSGELAGVRRQLSTKDADVRRLSDELGSSARAARRVEKRLADAQLRLSALTEGGAYRELHARVDVLESRLEEEIRAARAERRRRIELEREASELRTERDGMHALVAELGAECEALEHMLEFAGRAADDSAAEPAPRLDLGGRRIAYLGGGRVSSDTSGRSSGDRTANSFTTTAASTTAPGGSDAFSAKPTPCCVPWTASATAPAFAPSGSASARPSRSCPCEARGCRRSWAVCGWSRNTAATAGVAGAGSRSSRCRQGRGARCRVP